MSISSITYIFFGNYQKDVHKLTNWQLFFHPFTISLIAITPIIVFRLFYYSLLGLIAEISVIIVSLLGIYRGKDHSPFETFILCLIGAIIVSYCLQDQGYLRITISYFFVLPAIAMVAVLVFAIKKSISTFRDDKR